jgi:hypothetical protein
MKKLFTTIEILTIGALKKKKSVLLGCVCVCVCVFFFFLLLGLLMHVLRIREETDSREKVVEISELCVIGW